MPFRILFAALLATATGQSIVISLLPSLGREAKLEEWQIAVMMSSSAFIFALGTNVWSRVAASKGFRRVLMLGLSGYTLGTLLFASVWWMGFGGGISVSTLFVVLLVSRSLQSSIMSATPPAAIGYTLRIAPLNARVQALGKVTSANHLGQVIGPSLVGLLVPLGMLTPLFMVAGGTLLALFWVARRLPEAPCVETTNTPQSTPSSSVDRLPQAAIFLVVASASLFCCLAMLQQSLGFYFMDVYGATPEQAARQLGVVMLISAIASLLTQLVFMQRTTGRAASLVMRSYLFLVTAYVMVWLHSSMSVLWMSAALLGIGMGIGYPSLTAAATSLCCTQQQAKVTGLMTATPAMGYVIGPPLGAWLYTVNNSHPFLAAVLLLSILAIAMLWKRASL